MASFCEKLFVDFFAVRDLNSKNSYLASAHCVYHAIPYYASAPATPADSRLAFWRKGIVALIADCIEDSQHFAQRYRLKVSLNRELEVYFI